jgi:thioredoxin-related protein
MTTTTRPTAGPGRRNRHSQSSPARATQADRRFRHGWAANGIPNASLPVHPEHEPEHTPEGRPNMGCHTITRYSLLLGLLLTTSAVGAQEPSTIDWHHDLSQAIKITRAEQRPMLLFITTDGCAYCHLMEQNTFSDAAVAADVAGSFIATSVNAAQQTEVAQKLGIRLFPTTVIITASDGVVDTIDGYVGSDELRARIAPYKFRTQLVSTHPTP